MSIGHVLFILAMSLVAYTRHVLPPRALSLRAKVLLVQATTTVLLVMLLSLVFLEILGVVLQEQAGERVLGVAHTVALMPEVRDAFATADPSAIIQPLAESVRRATGVAFVVVANRDQVRYSHPVPERIGQLLSTDGQLALDGVPYVVAETGTLGRSIRAKVPIVGDDGLPIGVVSVGVLEERVVALASLYGPRIAGVAGLALLLGLAVSVLLARHVKRQIFGLEPAEIASLLEQREALLHGIREGVVAIDPQGRVSVVNDAAVRLLDLPSDIVGQPLAAIIPESGLDEVLRTQQPQGDRLTLLNGRPMVVNRMPVRLRGELVGAISTFRDQSELQRLAQELNGTRSHLDALRAQAHEFANRLHTISGFIELGMLDRAVSLINQTTRTQQQLIEDLPARLRDPSLAALLVGKASIAAERSIQFDVQAEGELKPTIAAGPDLVTIVGNLVDNAFEATEGIEQRHVQVRMAATPRELVIEVRDNGPGIPLHHQRRVFEEGFSTKHGERSSRGIGLALVQRSVERLGGAIALENDRGAVFTVRVPHRPPPARRGRKERPA